MLLGFSDVHWEDRTLAMKVQLEDDNRGELIEGSGPCPRLSLGRMVVNVCLCALSHHISN